MPTLKFVDSRRCLLLQGSIASYTQCVLYTSEWVAVYACKRLAENFAAATLHLCASLVSKPARTYGAGTTLNDCRS